ncbi:hypothetical protein [Micromonospora inositola]|uniref:SurA N-terminal domain-containing protein n=1 Tax=Micromonospora inositola TaxID=47865 RepID=A0A1C5H7X3_9ACTN|nr:hypothetical protein [Micromonospora inositola]SCG42122.1 hypothetical protein GA0070613_0951 [Micromonospora inositola]
MRARRLTAAASVAALALLCLAACGRSAPDVAAYVGDKTYSVDRVDAIHDEAQAAYEDSVKASAAQQGATPSPEQLKLNVDRQDILNLLVGIDLGKRIAEEQKVEVQDQLSAEQIGKELGVPNTEYAKLAAEWYDLYLGLQAGLPPAELTDDSRGDLYDALVKAGVAPAGWSADEQRKQFEQAPFTRQVSAVSAALQDEVKKLDVTVNPRFPALEIPALLQTQSGFRQYDLPYVDGNGQVTDVSTPGPVATEATGQAAS